MSTTDQFLLALEAYQEVQAELQKGFTRLGFAPGGFADSTNRSSSPRAVSRVSIRVPAYS